MHSCWSIRAGVHKLQDFMSDYLKLSDVIKAEIKCTINIMHLNNPKTILPHPGPWKNCLHHKAGPWCQKGWGQSLEYCWTTEPHTQSLVIFWYSTQIIFMWLNCWKQADPVEDKTWPPKLTTISPIVSYILW